MMEVTCQLHPVSTTSNVACTRRIHLSLPSSTSLPLNTLKNVDATSRLILLHHIPATAAVSAPAERLAADMR